MKDFKNTITTCLFTAELLFPCTGIFAGTQSDSGKTSPDTENIRAFDIQAYLSAKSVECLDNDSSYKVAMLSLEYSDLTGDGKEEAVVTAQTCMMGNGGPDIHSVFYLGVSNAIKEYPVDFMPDKSTVIKGIPLPLIGNRNYYLRIKDSLLCAEYWDGSGREHPLRQYFKFDNGSFVVAREEYGTTYPTSFDCAKAKSDREIVACSCDSIASMDIELNDVYQRVLSTVNPEERIRLKHEQQQWLRDFDKVKAYRSTYDFAERYRARISQLKKMLVNGN